MLTTVNAMQIRFARRVVANPRPEDTERLRCQCWHILKMAKAGCVALPLQRNDAPDAPGAA